MLHPHKLERERDRAQVGDARAVLRQEYFARPLYWLRRVVIGLRSQVLPRSLLGRIGELKKFVPDSLAFSRHASKRRAR